MEIFKKPFIQVTVPPFEKQNSQNIIKADKLLELIKDDEFKKAIIAHYGLSSLDFHINIGNIGTAYKYVEYVSNKYEYINNLWSSNNQVKASFSASEENDSKAELYFEFDFLHDEDGVEYSGIKAKVEYDSSSQFYKDRELSKYVNYLKSKNNKTLSSIRDRNILIDDVNDSWKKQYARNPKSIIDRKFKFLKDKKGNYFLKSIASKAYKEYGVSFCFVISMLSLHKAMQKDKGLNLDINSLSLNESKIDIIVSSGNPVFVKEIGRFLSSSILINNNDLGNKSLSFTHSVKLTPLQNDENKLFLFPKFKDSELKYKMSAGHITGVNNVLKLFDNLSSVLYSVDDYVKDFKEIAKTNTPDELRQKIEEKIVSSNSPYKGIKKLKDLFSRSSVQHIDNLAKLLEICQKAELIDMEYDLKFQLRYLISNVLLYGKN